MEKLPVAFFLNVPVDIKIVYDHINFLHSFTEYVKNVHQMILDIYPKSKSYFNP